MKLSEKTLREIYDYLSDEHMLLLGQDIPGTEEQIKQLNSLLEEIEKVLA